MNLFLYFKNELTDIVKELVQDELLPEGLDLSRVSVEPPRDASHGDVATNAAMVLAKATAMKPRDLATLLAERFMGLEDVREVEIAGPGFINLRIADGFWHHRLREVLRAGPAYGDSIMGAGAKVNVEYVSANPTGPMHVGHGRGAVVGDALAALLDKAGYDVTREYYINDAGAQIDALARSLHLRYREALGETIGDFPEGLYPGDYLIAPAKALAGEIGYSALNAVESAWIEEFRVRAIDAMMALIRDDLAALGVTFDVFSSERALVRNGGVESALDDLRHRGLIYEGVLEPPKGKTPDDWEPREQTLFRATDFGDDVDRPVRKSDGTWTYFATDMAYHLDKYRRGFATMIDVWGADHGGYVKRMKAAVKALTEEGGALDVKLCQMVNLLDDGQPVKMSKRAGTFVTLRDLVDRVGKDVVRFIMLTRKNDAHLDFDLARVTEQSRDNPVFYVQYAHARIRSVLRLAADEWPDRDLSARALADADVSCLTDEAELALIKCMAAWPRLVESAAEAHEPHRVAYYLDELATLFHALWTKGKEDTTLRFILPEDERTTLARMALIQGVAAVIASGLGVFGVTPVEELR
ncbi:MAG: arginine--tRNA ligase [Rhodobacterales bacterium]|nr:arginine--tRNA ligase [Rhodobacterales bacterium]